MDPKILPTIGTSGIRPASFEDGVVDKKGIAPVITDKLNNFQLEEVSPKGHHTKLSPIEKLNAIVDECRRQSDKLNALKMELLELKAKQAADESLKAAAEEEAAKQSSVRQTLQNLCREIQRTNKTVTERANKLVKEEQQLRHELCVKINSSIAEISKRNKEVVEERNLLAKEVQLLKEKVGRITAAHESKESQFASQLRVKNLEVLTAEARMKQQQKQCSLEEERARMFKEQVANLMHQDNDLKSQIASYAEKFEQFQDALTKSNDMYISFKGQIDKMTESMKILEKENQSLKSKVSETDASFMGMLEEKLQLKKQLDAANKQRDQLESLCRRLRESQRESNHNN